MLLLDRSEQESTPVVSGLIETVDKVMVQMVSSLESSPSPHSLISLGGKSFVAGQYHGDSTLSSSDCTVLTHCSV